MKKSLLAVLGIIGMVGYVNADDSICLGGNCNGVDKAVLVGSSISATNPTDQLVLTAGGGVFQVNRTSVQLNGAAITGGAGGSLNSFAGGKATSSVDMAGFAVINASAVSLSGTSGSSISTTNDQLTVQTVGGVLQVNNSSIQFNNGGFWRLIATSAPVNTSTFTASWTGSYSMLMFSVESGSYPAACGTMFVRFNNVATASSYALQTNQSSGWSSNISTTGVTMDGGAIPTTFTSRFDFYPFFNLSGQKKSGVAMYLNSDNAAATAPLMRQIYWVAQIAAPITSITVTNKDFLVPVNARIFVYGIE